VCRRVSFRPVSTPLPTTSLAPVPQASRSSASGGRCGGGAGALEVAHDDGAEATVPGLDAGDRRRRGSRRPHCDPTQRRAYVLADNKLALNAGWDLEMLSLEIGELGEAGFDLSLTGFDEFELGELWSPRASNALPRLFCVAAQSSGTRSRLHSSSAAR
jgi:hypothetical protein